MDPLGTLIISLGTLLVLDSPRSARRVGRPRPRIRTAGPADGVRN